MNRTAEITRNTNETQVRVALNLDGTGQQKLNTGVPFLDHMLDQIARHGLIDLDIEATGDVHIDNHHTVEDVGITLGMAVAKAIGDKKGIRRYGHAYVPLDEALSRVVLDFSGRPGIEYHIPFTRAMIGSFDVDLTLEFFRGFVNHARRDLAYRQPARHECPPSVRNRVQGLWPRAAHGCRARSSARPASFHRPRAACKRPRTTVDSEIKHE